MIEMTTRSAQKQRSHRTVAFVYMPAFRARPACVARINGDDWNARQENAQFLSIQIAAQSLRDYGCRILARGG